MLGQQEDESGNPAELWTAGFWIDGEWRSELDLNFNPVSIAALPGSRDRWVILGSENGILWVDSTATIPSGRRTHVNDSDPVAFTNLCVYNGGVAAAQLGHKIYWSEGADWLTLGTGLPKSSGGATVGFEAMTTLDDCLYGVGRRGEIWCMRNSRWTQIHSPVNIILTGVTSADGEIIACGRLGMIARGHDDCWRVVDHDQTDEDFWSVVYFKGRIYLSSMTGIYELSDDLLTPVDDDSEVGSYYHLSANSEIMISVGARAVSMFDGDQWRQLF
ncbi:MAG: hypothetical protein P8166_14190 [Candidatus Thiodiazotropha sp.]